MKRLVDSLGNREYRKDNRKTRPVWVLTQMMMGVKMGARIPKHDWGRQTRAKTGEIETNQRRVSRVGIPIACNKEEFDRYMEGISDTFNS